MLGLKTLFSTFSGMRELSRVWGGRAQPLFSFNTQHVFYSLPSWALFAHLWSLPISLSRLLPAALLTSWLLTSWLDLGKALSLDLSFLFWTKMNVAATGVVSAITNVSCACCETSNHSTMRMSNIKFPVTLVPSLSS